MATDNRYWFGRKRLGFGWGPRSWEGWLTLAVYALLMVTLPRYVGPALGEFSAHIVMIALTVAFFVVFFWKMDRSGSR